jgi:hypothetical protein
MGDLILKDFFFLDPTAGRKGGPSSIPDVREIAQSGKGLKVTIVASHAGMVNSNNNMYSPFGMKASTHTWVWPQKKPFMIYHDDSSDPIGRVIGSRYSPYNSSSINDDYRDSFEKYSDSSENGNLLEAARILEDSEVLSQEDWRGVGELIVEAIITDSEAIEKVLDGRYQGVSISQRPKQAFCSLCGQDWISDSYCEHNRGEIDEETGRKMYLIVGDTIYTEISYVNQPADPYAQNTSAEQIKVDPNSESPNVFDNYSRTAVTFQLVDSIEEEVDMKDKNSASDTDSNVDSLADQEEPTSNELPSETEESKDVPDSEDKEEITIDGALQCLFETPDDFTSEMAELVNDELENLIEDSSEDKDAKLSTKQRKSLPSNAFCGPNRSFPVPDCTHVTAARRLVGRYKGKGSKTKIMSCIDRKAKALGCDSKNDACPCEEQDQTKAELSLDQLSDSQLSKLLLDVEKDMTSRGLRAERRCDDCEVKDQKISDFETKVPQLQDTIKVLREEYRNVTYEFSSLEESHTEKVSEFRQILHDAAVLAISLIDHEVEDIETKVKAMTFDELKDTIKNNDFSKIISFVRSGMSRIPEESVTPEDAEQSKTTIPKDKLEICKRLISYRDTYGSKHAISCMTSYIRNNKLPLDFTLDKASELVAK